MEESSKISAEDYYQSLTKKQKGLFLKYLTIAFGFSHNTMCVKLSNSSRCVLKPIERKVIDETIQSRAWQSIN